MSESDSFIEEVTEEVRRDAMYKAWRRYGPFVIGVIVLVVLAAAGKAWWDDKLKTEAQARGGAFLAAQGTDDPAASARAFDELANASEADFAALARLQAGAGLTQAGDGDAAAVEYEAVAAMTDVDPRLRDLARLRVVMLTESKAEPQALLDALAPLSAEGAPWRATALEFEASARLRMNDIEGARAALEKIVADSAAPGRSAQRAAEALAALAGDAE